jgi:DNA-binding beta-propeller fold protein YncE
MMKDKPHNPPRLGRLGWLLLGTTLVAWGCSSDKSRSTVEPEDPEGLFKSLEVAANAPETFMNPRAGAPLPDGRVAFLATDTASGAMGLFMQSSKGTSLLYKGASLVAGHDLDTSIDYDAILVADPAVVTKDDNGNDVVGAISRFSLSGGEPEQLALGYAPVAVTVGAGGVYFSGRDPQSGERGVFRLSGRSASPVHTGAPLVDPSGIALLSDGSVLVADTSLHESTSIIGEAGVVLLKDGAATVFATGFTSGYPAGIAVTVDEKSLIVSGESMDQSDTVYIFNMAEPAAAPTVVTAEFSAQQDSSAGLHRLREENTYVWASGSFSGGTVYRIQSF